MAKTKDWASDIDRELEILSMTYAIAIPDLVEQLKTLLKKDEHNEYSGIHEAISVAHQLRGSAGVNGFTEVSLSAGILEDQLNLLRNSNESDSGRLRSSAEAALSILDALSNKITFAPIDRRDQEKADSEEIAGPRVAASQVDTVLLVDDDPAFVKFVRAVLASGKHASKVLSVERLDEALLLLNEVKPDVLLLDLGLPDSNGLDTFLGVRKSAEDVPILILSALDDALLADKAVACGAQDYLIKGRMSKGALRRCVRYAKSRFQVEQKAQRLKAIGDFTATIAHDFKGPVQAMERITRHILSQNILSGELTESVKVLHSSNKRLLSHLDKLLELYSLEFGSVSPEISESDILFILQTCLEIKSQDFECRNLRSELTIQSNTLVATDSALIKKIVLELLENACRFAYPSTTVNLSLHVEEQSASITVTSMGPTIPSSQLNKLFKSFWLGTPGESYVASTGTGLYYCNQIARILGGTMSCTSSHGETSFRLQLRIHDD